MTVINSLKMTVINYLKMTVIKKEKKYVYTERNPKKKERGWDY